MAEKEKGELIYKIHQHRDKFPDSSILRCVNVNIDLSIDELRIIALKCELEEVKSESFHYKQTAVRAILLGGLLFIDKHGLDKLNKVDDNILKLKRDIMTHLKM